MRTRQASARELKLSATIQAALERLTRTITTLHGESPPVLAGAGNSDRTSGPLTVRVSFNSP
jgi:hypothetical protein